jgi:hypothetical protein
VKRRIQGLVDTAPPTSDQVPDGVFLVLVEKAQYRWHAQKPFYLLRLSVLEPLVGLEIVPRLGSILKLDVLERFVFVISVLEGYSSQDCSILLGCSRKVIVDARARALEQLANGAEIIPVQGDELQDIYSLAS